VLNEYTEAVCALDRPQRPRRTAATTRPAFATERGKQGYAKNRNEFNKLIWRLASPKWGFDDETYDRTAASFDNPDHVGVVTHNYRQGLVQGEAK
jgi:hypothetical protein